MPHCNLAIKQEVSQLMADFRHLRLRKEELTVPEAFNCSKEFDMIAMIDLGISEGSCVVFVVGLWW
jgi:hypothetical protein